MRKWSLFAALLIAGGCAPNFEEDCMKAGFQPGTSAYSSCVAEKEAEMAAWREEVFRYRSINVGGGI